MAIRVRECLLDASNHRRVCGTSIGERIKALRKDYLWNTRPLGVVVDTIVVHYISAINRRRDRPWDEAGILALLCELGLSAHYLVGRAGGVTRLVPQSKRAWHAGGSIMPGTDGRQSVNDFSVGVELVGMEGVAFTPAQYRTLAGLCLKVAAGVRDNVKIVGHEHVAGRKAVQLGLRRDSKQDPGQLFSWIRLARILGPKWRTWEGGLVRLTR